LIKKKKKEDIQHYIHVVEAKTIHKKFRYGRRRKNIREKKKSLYLYFVLQTFHQFDRNKSSIREKNIKKYLDPGEGEKIHEKNKSLYLYCILETIHPSPTCIHLRKKNTKKY